MTPKVEEVGPATSDALVALLSGLPEGDRTFIREDLDDPVVRERLAQPGLRWVAVDDGAVVGYAGIQRLPGWSDHVGEVRLVVSPQHRGTGVGKVLARQALVGAVGAGIRKVVVEVAAEQEHAIAMFTALGFTGEALLRDHIRDRTGQLRDLVVLAHLVDDTWAAMAAVGLDESSIGGN